MKVFLNGRIRTMDGTAPLAAAMIVDEGAVAAVGDSATIREMARAGDEIVDLEGRCVLPGFHDAHVHLSDGAITLTRVDLRASASAEEAAALVRERSTGIAWGTWIRGNGWDHTKWGPKAWPHRSVLDAVVADHPVALARVDGHVGWVNSLALRALGIDRSTTDPPGGTIVRDPGTHEPTGVLVETAWDEARSRVPKEKKTDRLAALGLALRELARVGVTAVHDITDPPSLALLAELRAEGKLSLRVSALLPIDLDQDAAEVLRRSHPEGDPWLSTGTLKIFLDGTLGSRSAALLAPYADDASSTGTLRIPPGELDRMVAKADASGFAVAIHAIGDRALRVALDSFERLPERERRRPHRIEHVQVAAEADLPRFRQLGIVASTQPVHFSEDLPWIADRIGEREGTRAYPVRSLFDAGALVAFGTDWPIAPIDPWLGIRAAVARALAGADEEISLDAALRAYTSAPAITAGRGDSLGRLAPGYRADFIVLDRDPESPSAVNDLPRVTSTYVNGERVYP